MAMVRDIGARRYCLLTIGLAEAIDIVTDKSQDFRYVEEVCVLKKGWPLTNRLPTLPLGTTNGYVHARVAATGHVFRV